MREQKYQAYMTDWEGVTKVFELSGLFFESLVKDKSKVIFKNSVSDIETLLVEHKNIRQYTGLNDKNGNPIYEGDIVKISDHPFQGSIDINGNYEVCHNEYMELSCGGWYLHRMRHWAEVIGNKFENPELLKGANENE
ncbi:MAG TPA: YopX family protein [Paenibacillus sp.]|jgi:hypothetical protein